MSSKWKTLGRERKAIREAVEKAVRGIEEKEETETVELELESLRVRASLSTMGVLFGFTIPIEEGGEPITDFIEVLQGVTWGGRGVEKVFDLSEEDVGSLNLESDLVYRRIGGEDVKPWRIEWTRRYVLFPYVRKEGEWVRAFELEIKGDIKQQLPVNDALDIEQPIDDAEKRILKQHIADEEKRKKVLDHRVALGLVKYPNTATYLVQHYEELAGRVFEDKTLEEYNKMWYEFHRNRTPEIIGTPRIVGPRLLKTARFAFDEEGFLPRDSVVVMLPREECFEKIRGTLAKVLCKDISSKEALLYLLGFLNSGVFNKILGEKISKKRGGYPIVDERLLQKLRIPIPVEEGREEVERLLGLATKATSGGLDERDEDRIDESIAALYGLKEKSGEPKVSLQSFVSQKG